MGKIILLYKLKIEKPRDLPDSTCPFVTDCIPPRKISVPYAIVLIVKARTPHQNGSFNKIQKKLSLIYLTEPKPKYIK